MLLHFPSSPFVLFLLLLCEESAVVFIAKFLKLYQKVSEVRFEGLEVQVQVEQPQNKCLDLLSGQIWESRDEGFADVLR